ncbi:hypothetical protein A8C02_00405 (plasmid) [Klebsiella pneumoniae]|nr:hypothetical protein A8C02_00405 [Klebsiella pneumoniae]
MISLSPPTICNSAGGRHLATLTGDLEQAVLVHRPLDARRQVERLPRFEAFDVFQQALLQS